MPLYPGNVQNSGYPDQKPPVPGNDVAQGVQQAPPVPSPDMFVQGPQAGARMPPQPYPGPAQQAPPPGNVQNGAPPAAAPPGPAQQAPGNDMVVGAPPAAQPPGPAQQAPDLQARILPLGTSGPTLPTQGLNALQPPGMTPQAPANDGRTPWGGDPANRGYRQAPSNSGRRAGRRKP